MYDRFFRSHLLMQLFVLLLQNHGRHSRGCNSFAAAFRPVLSKRNGFVSRSQSTFQSWMRERHQNHHHQQNHQHQQRFHSQNRILFSRTASGAFSSTTLKAAASSSSFQDDNYVVTSEQQAPRMRQQQQQQTQQDRPLPENDEHLPQQQQDDDYFSPIVRGLNPSQLAAVTQPFYSVSRVVAGPGSGKTRVLTSRIAFLLQQQPPVDNDEENDAAPDYYRQEQHQNHRILAVTFTRKAAGEMQLRLERLLGEHAQWKAEESMQQQQQQFQQENDDYDGEKDIMVEYNAAGHDDDTGASGGARSVGLDRVTLGTFHSICAKILRWNGVLLDSLPSIAEDMVGSSNRTNLDGTFTIADEASQLRILKDCLDELNIDLQNMQLRPQRILSAFSQIKSNVAEGKGRYSEPSSSSNDDKKKSPPLSNAMKVASKVYLMYREKLLCNNCIDFDDLILMTRELLLEYDDVRERLHRRWTHVLVDEFQDTSTTQMDLVKLLTRSSLLVVGDADQSIYSWRGANVESLSNFEREFGNVQTIYLMENYRSTSNIVKAAQKVISHSSGKSGADQLRQDMKPVRGKGPAPRIVASSDDQSEAEFVIKSIKNSISSGGYAPDHSVAIIYRTNLQSRALEEACVKNNLPYVIFGSSNSFYKRLEIKDCLCFLKWFYNGRDRAAMLRAITTPKRGIGDSAIAEFDGFCSLVEEHYDNVYPGRPKPNPLQILFSLSDDADDLFALPKDVPSPTGYIAKRPLKLLSDFGRQLRSIHNRAYEEPLENILTAVITDLDLIQYFDKISKSNSEFEDRKANVHELQQAAQKYNAGGPCLKSRDGSGGGTDEDFGESPLGSFLDDVALVTDLADRSSEERFVANLMTIHASKGMEFDTVFVVGNEDGTFPTGLAIADGGTSLEEEQRLCYVAMTRAKTELIMTWRHETRQFTKEGIRTVRRDRSRFLNILAGDREKNQEASKTMESGSARNSPRDSMEPLSRDRKNAFGRQASRLSTSSHNVKNPQTRSYSTEYSRKQPVKISQPRTSFEGTASVYSNTRKTNPPQTSQARTMNTSPMRTTKSQGALSIYENKRTSKEGFKERPQVSQPRKPDTFKSKPVARREYARPKDSTLFFPVGSFVQHKHFGRGLVLNPPQADSSTKEMPVQVRFPNGRTQIFSALEGALLPTS